MYVTHITRIVTIVALGLLAAGCGDEPGTPVLDSRAQTQLSAGGGIASYEFRVNGTRVGVLLVNGDQSVGQAGYTEFDMEYWRWEAGSLAALETGGVTTVDVTEVRNIDSGDSATDIWNLFDDTTTQGWTEWEINRDFDFSSTSSVHWNAPSLGDVLFTVEADGWDGFQDGAGETVTYFLKMTFGSDPHPAMAWYLDYSDYQAWRADPDCPCADPLPAACTGEDTDMYEVRLNESSVLTQTLLGLGFELKTLSD